MKIIVEIDLGEHVTPERFEQARADWFPTGDPTIISVDETFLPVDPEDGAYRLFKYVGVA